MNHAQYLHMKAILDEHAHALKLLQAVSEGEDGLQPKVHDFLKKVAERKEREQVTANVKANNQEKRKKTGRMNSGAFEVCPRQEGGSDFGVEGLVLARMGKVRLVWRKGSKTWANQLEGSVYSPGNLTILTEASSRYHRPEIAYLTDNRRESGGPDTRVSRRLIEKFAERIDSVFGPGVAEQVAHLKQTIVIEVPVC